MLSYLIRGQVKTKWIQSEAAASECLANKCSWLFLHIINFSLVRYRDRSWNPQVQAWVKNVRVINIEIIIIRNKKQGKKEGMKCISDARFSLHVDPTKVEK